MEGSGKDGKRVLVVADQALRGDEVRDKLIAELGGKPSEVFVVAPALAKSGLEHTMGDVDDGRERAQERLDQTLEELRGAGLEVNGEVGDSDPLLAISDEVVKFQPDRIFVIANPQDSEAYAEKDLVSRAERDLDQPVTELIVEGGGSDQHVVDVEETAPEAGRGKGKRPSGNFPPLTKRDILGIAVAVIGTIIAGALAAAGTGADDSRIKEEGYLNSTAAIMLLIALFTALVNLAHVVGLLFFQSVRYKGPFEKFFSRTSLIGTPIAIVVLVILYFIAS